MSKRKVSNNKSNRKAKFDYASKDGRVLFYTYRHHQYSVVKNTEWSILLQHRQEQGYIDNQIEIARLIRKKTKVLEREQGKKSLDAINGFKQFWKWLDD